MKKICIKFLLPLLVLAALIPVEINVMDRVSAVLDAKNELQNRKHAPIEMRASHEIEMIVSDELVGFCTATAIGPHALLTANHCDENNEVTKLHLDLSMQNFNVISTMKDDSDHIIILVDGPEFKSYLDLTSWPMKYPVTGEKLVSYTHGRREYLPHTKTGIELEKYDVSDVNRNVFFSSMVAISGDSGSLVFSQKDHSIIGIITYALQDNDYMSPYSAGFSLNFNSSDYKKAKEFKPTTKAEINTWQQPQQHLQQDRQLLPFFHLK